MRLVALGLAGREVLACDLADAISRDLGPESLPDAGEVFPVGELPAFLLDSADGSRFDLGNAAGRAAALRRLLAADAEDRKRKAFRAQAWSLLSRLLLGERFSALWPGVLP